jgi:hypothetical protein
LYATVVVVTESWRTNHPTRNYLHATSKAPSGVLSLLTPAQKTETSACLSNLNSWLNLERSHFFWIMMPHVTAPSLSADTTHTGHGHAPPQNKSGENRMNGRLTSQGIQLDLRCLSAKSLLAVPDSSASSRSPQTQKFNVLPTPPSTTSAIFDSPQKPSPSSSISSTNALAIVQRSNTPIAELEDTSQAYAYPELEDTSNRAIRSRSATFISSYTIKSGNSTVSRVLNLF